MKKTHTALLFGAWILIHGMTRTALAGDVAATVETQPVASSGDAADDLCIWIHPTDPAQSLVIGTDKKRGLEVYDFSGKRLQELPDGELNNVDLRYQFPLGGKRVALVAASDRSANTISLYRVDDQKRTLIDVAAGPVNLGIEVYGCCLYRSPRTGEYYFFGTSKSGGVEQWRLFDDGSGRVDAQLVRAFDVGSDCEGCVADDHYGRFFVSEESTGIWRYDAEPGSGTARVQVDSTGSGGHLDADVEGLAIYSALDGTGYLIASSQGSSEFVVYTREADHRFISSFRIISGAVDSVSGTDGIDVTPFPIGAGFSFGAFVVQDGQNNSGNQNFKLVPWEDVARSVSPPLTIETHSDPRQEGASPIRLFTTPMGEADAGSDLTVEVGSNRQFSTAAFLLLTSLDLAPDGRGLSNPTVLVLDTLDSVGSWQSKPLHLPPSAADTTVFVQALALHPTQFTLVASPVVPSRIR